MENGICNVASKPTFCFDENNPWCHKQINQNNRKQYYSSNVFIVGYHLQFVLFLDCNLKPYCLQYTLCDFLLPNKMSLAQIGVTKYCFAMDGPIKANNHSNNHVMTVLCHYINWCKLHG